MKNSLRPLAIAALAGIALGACSAGQPTGQSPGLELGASASTQEKLSHVGGRKQVVHASWYNSGRRTANGEKFIPKGMTAAHKTLPFNTKVLVENPKTGASVVVRINDRGPFIKGRTLDLAEGAAGRIGMISAGVGPVVMTILERPAVKSRLTEIRKVGIDVALGN